MRRVISLFLPSWATDRWRRARRENTPEAGTLKPAPADVTQSPLILVARQGSRRLVYAADAAARGLGVHPGMAVSQAQAMLPGLRVEPAEPEADAAALRQLAAWCLRFSPLVSHTPPDGLWIDSTGCDHLHGGEATLLLNITRKLAQSGIAARAAMAGTPGCAHAVARYGTTPLSVVRPGEEAEALATLPLGALRLAPDLADALARLGFEHIGALAATPRAPLARRFGSEPGHRLDQALGRAPEPLDPIHPPDLCRVRQGFPEPIATPDDLARITTLLTGALCAKLRQRNQGATQLDLVFQRVDGVPQTIRIGTAAPSRDAAHLTRLLIARIETVDPGFGIDAVWLAASRAAPLGARQVASDLVTSAETPDLTPLVDTLINRLGPEQIFRAAPVESDVPERSVRRAGPLGGRLGSWPATLPRPPRLLTPPRRVEALALLPDHPPVQFTWRRKPHRIRRADGPERIFGEWWLHADEVFAVRDYFQVEDEAGQRFWLFRRGDGQDAATGDLSWYLHGLFA